MDGERISLSGVSVLLTIIFAAMKLTGVVAWSWWWVLSPVLILGGVWMAFAIVLLVILGGRK